MSLNKIFFLVTVFFFQNSFAQNSVEIDISKTTSDISSTMYGVFFEDINFSADGGLYAELIKNRSFEFTLPKMGWFEPNSDRHSYNEDSGISTVMRYKGYNSNKRYLNVKVNNSENYELINEGFRGIGVKKDITYNFSILAANTKGINKITLELYADENIIGTSTIDLIEGSWRIYETVIKVNETNPKAKLKLKFEGEGSLDIDMISLFPSDTWKGRKNGLRKDLVELIEDLNPGFIRFPGGCIVEGRTLDRRYQWKKTIGPIENRELIVNRWNTEFSHRNTPDYYQSFGLGFFEYFLLSEDLNAEPLPILGCGMACQFNTGELVPMDDMGPYIQDALDLIEFANGGITTHWGKLRAEMGHPEPFNMKYIGIGNEQWGPEYIKRYKVFDKAIKEKYPDIIIISGSGPFPEGDFFEYGWEELKKLNVEIVDEHFYKSPDWFKKNANRYDSYDRNGPKVFAGEYAAQSDQIASPKNKNNWECALSEAAFMTGMERNADVVRMTSYAPLMAHTEAWQWKTDLIWFDNLTSYGTPSYYVQKLYAEYSGTEVIDVKLNGSKATGQNGLFISAVKDSIKSKLIIKVANTSGKINELNLSFNGGSVNNELNFIELSHQNIDAENSIDSPNEITPVVSNIILSNISKSISIKPNSFNVLVFQIK